jgi:hypothetical protein
LLPRPIDLPTPPPFFPMFMKLLPITLHSSSGKRYQVTVLVP